MSASPDILRDFSTLQADVDRLNQANVELANRLMAVKCERDEAREQLRLANIDCFAALTELDAAQKYADAAMFERDQLRMRVAELQNGIVVEAAK